MPGTPVRYGPHNPNDPVQHELPPLRYGEEVIALRLELRRTDDGYWRGRLLFGPAEGDGGVSTADIFCAGTETDLWECVYGLRDHHLRDLYRSVSE